MAKRRQRQDQFRAPDAEYVGEDAILILRGAMTPKTREAYKQVATGESLAPAGAREDAWHRSVEFLFERLAVSWVIAGAEPLRKQKELLARFRFATVEERAWIRQVLREHLTEHFPELPVP